LLGFWEDSAGKALNPSNINAVMIKENGMKKGLRWENLKIGDKAGPIQYVITPEIIDAFADATEDFGSWHMQDSPFGDRIAHVTLNITDYSLILSRAHGGFHTGLHSRQASEFFHPLKLGDTITARGEIVELFQRRNRDFYTFCYEAFNQSGILLTRHKLTTSVDREGPPVSVITPAPQAEPSGKSDAPQKLKLPDITRVFTQEKMTKFASQTGFRLGIKDGGAGTHTDIEAARRVGLPDTVVQSNHYYSWYSEMMLKFLGEGWVCGGRMEGKFFGMVFPNDTVTVRGEVSRSEKQGDNIRIHVDLSTTRQDGQPVSVASASGFAGKRIPEPGWPVSKWPPEDPEETFSLNENL